MKSCCCGGKPEYTVHSPHYCGTTPQEVAFPPYSLYPKYLKGTRQRTNRVKVELILHLPRGCESATAAQIEEWLRFRLGDYGLLHPSPISEEELPAPLVFSWGWAY